MSQLDVGGSAELCVDAPPPPSDAIAALAAMREEVNIEVLMCNVPSAGRWAS